MSNWQPIPGKIQTRWAQQVNPACPLPEYPRPQMRRPVWLNLNGLWDYAIQPRADETMQPAQGQILVPFAVESALSGVCKPLLPEQRLWYRRSFNIPANWKKQRVLLHFGAVDWHCELWCNGVWAGEHRGGYDPFTVELTTSLRFGAENELVVAVWDPSDSARQEHGKQTLNPDKIFYSAISGIWQTVWLEVVPNNYIERLYLTTDIDSGLLRVQVDLCDGQGLPQTCSLKIVVKDGQAAFTTQSTHPLVEITLTNPRLWWPHDPFLYDLEVSLLDGETVLDCVESYFGMRQVTLEKDPNGIPRICINHDPVFQYGPLDQGYWPDGLYTAPTEEALIHDIQFCKDLGMNMIRKHIKVEPARWYYHCDRLGMLVWQDMPNGGKLPHTLVLGMGFILNLKLRDDHNYPRFGREDPAVRENYRRELKAMINNLSNHPCIVVWVPFNESWGQFDARSVTAWLKAYDPTRLVDSASGWFDQNCGDIYSVHKYVGPGMPKPERNRAIALSEFGGIGLNEPGHTWVTEKLFAYRMVKSREELTAWYLRLIEKLEKLKQRGLSAAIYTETCDVEFEVNGYLTYDREIMKMDADAIKAAHKRLIGNSG
jgi:beta-galactosidase/beta-glucuronidase